MTFQCCGRCANRVPVGCGVSLSGAGFSRREGNGIGDGGIGVDEKTRRGMRDGGIGVDGKARGGMRDGGIGVDEKGRRGMGVDEKTRRGMRVDEKTRRGMRSAYARVAGKDTRKGCLYIGLLDLKKHGESPLAGVCDGFPLSSIKPPVQRGAGSVRTSPPPALTAKPLPVASDPGRLYLESWKASLENKKNFKTTSHYTSSKPDFT